MDQFASVPQDVLIEILARAGGGTAGRCATVSKNWLAATRAELTWKLCTRYEFPEDYSNHLKKRLKTEWKNLYSSLYELHYTNLDKYITDLSDYNVSNERLTQIARRLTSPSWYSRFAGNGSVVKALDALLTRLEADEIGEKHFSSSALQADLFDAALTGLIHVKFGPDENSNDLEYHTRNAEVHRRVRRLGRPRNLKNNPTALMGIFWLSIFITSFIPLSIPTKMLILAPIMLFSSSISLLFANYMLWASASRLIACFATEWTNTWEGLIHPLPVLIPAVLFFQQWIMLMGPPFAVGWLIRWYFVDFLTQSSASSFVSGLGQVLLNALSGGLMMMLVVPTIFVTYPELEHLVKASVSYIPGATSGLVYILKFFNRHVWKLESRCAILARKFCTTSISSAIAEISHSAGMYTHADYGGKATIMYGIWGLAGGAAAFAVHTILKLAFRL